MVAIVEEEKIRVLLLNAFVRAAFLQLSTYLHVNNGNGTHHNCRKIL